MTDQLNVALLKTGIRMTADTYFSLPETNQPIQLLNGALLVSPLPIPWHQLIVGNVYQLLLSLIPNGKIFLSPIALYLDADNVPEPDLVWVAADSRCVMAEKRLEGPPELIIEVLSPGTARYDKTERSCCMNGLVCRNTGWQTRRPNRLKCGFWKLASTPASASSGLRSRSSRRY